MKLSVWARFAAIGVVTAFSPVMARASSQLSSGIVSGETEVRGWVGVRMVWPVALAVDKPVSEDAQGLPKGLKFTYRAVEYMGDEIPAYSIYGSSLQGGRYAVEVTVTDVSGIRQSVRVQLEIAELPDDVIGTFCGVIGHDGDDAVLRPYGMAEMRIADTGKIVARIDAGGRSHLFHESCFLESIGGDCFRFRLKNEEGDSLEGIMDTCAGMSVGSFSTGDGRRYRVCVWRHGDVDGGLDGAEAPDGTSLTLNAARSFGTIALSDYDMAYGSATLKICEDGTVALSGATLDGVMLYAKGILAVDCDRMCVICPMASYDELSGMVYHCSICWQPVFGADGDIAGWSTEGLDNSLGVYPFE